MRILHVIEGLTHGGATNALLALGRHCRPAGTRHAVLALHAPDAVMAEAARNAGFDVVPTDDEAEESRAVAGADIVHVHFWNNPALYEWLRRFRAEARLLLTVHVAGEHPAQVATSTVLRFADFVIASTSCSLRLPQFRALPPDRVRMVLSAPDFERLGRLAPQPHANFTVGYVGTVGFVKIHPDFVDMSAAARVPEARFVVCGGGDAVKPLALRAARLGLAERFEWRGHVDDVGAAYAGFDVFGYPLRHDSYASAELVLQEAMYSGVPPVVLAHGATAQLVEDRRTGLVAAGEREYALALERLHREPAERLRLGRNAREWASAHWGAANLAPEMATIYEQVMALPKHGREWPRQRLSAHAGADAFVEALGDAAEPFRLSLLSDDAAEQRAADESIARSSPVVSDVGAGGILHYRRHYPDDPLLRLWSGLVLLSGGHPALAAAEFHGARQLGLAQRRVEEYLNQSLAQCR